PSTLLKIYLYGYLNRVQSSRRLEREAQRNIELMWLTGRLAPDFKTIADFRKDNGAAIQSVCRQFVELCRRLKLFTGAGVAIASSLRPWLSRHSRPPAAARSPPWPTAATSTATRSSRAKARGSCRLCPKL